MTLLHRASRAGALLGAALALAGLAPAAARAQLPPAPFQSMAGAALGTGAVYVARATDNTPYVLNGAGGGTVWASLGGSTSDRPAVSLTMLSSAKPRVEVVVRGLDGSVFKKAYGDGSWGSWANLGGNIAGAPAVASFNDGTVNVHIFARGMDNHLWHKGYDGAWGNWEQLDNTMTLASSPTAQGNPGNLYVLARMTDGTLRLKQWTKASGWLAWVTVGPSDAGDPVSVRLQTSATFISGAGLQFPTLPFQAFYRSGGKYRRTTFGKWTTTDVGLAPGEYSVTINPDGKAVFLRPGADSLGEWAAAADTSAGTVGAWQHFAPATTGRYITDVRVFPVTDSMAATCASGYQSLTPALRTNSSRATSYLCVKRGPSASVSFVGAEVSVGACSTANWSQTNELPIGHLCFGQELRTPPRGVTQIDIVALSASQIAADTGSSYDALTQSYSTRKQAVCGAREPVTWVSNSPYDGGYGWGQTFPKFTTSDGGTAVLCVSR